MQDKYDFHGHCRVKCPLQQLSPTRQSLLSFGNKTCQGFNRKYLDFGQTRPSRNSMFASLQLNNIGQWLSSSANSFFGRSFGIRCNLQQRVWFDNNRSCDKSWGPKGRIYILRISGTHNLMLLNNKGQTGVERALK